MTNKMKRLTTLCILSLFIVLASACGNGASGGGISIGIVLPTKDEQRWVQDEQRFQGSPGRPKYKAKFLFSQGSSAKEKENVETLINKGIKVLIICPSDGDAAAAAVEAAKKEGISGHLVRPSDHEYRCRRLLCHVRQRGGRRGASPIPGRQHEGQRPAAVSVCRRGFRQQRVPVLRRRMESACSRRLRTAR